MTIYVDPIFTVNEAQYHGQSRAHAQYVGSRNGNAWCHMVSDVSDDELDAFALHIGLKVRWRDHDHYDLTPGKRILAIRAGAKEIGPNELLAISRFDRQGRPRPPWLTRAIEEEQAWKLREQEVSHSQGELPLWTSEQEASAETG